MSKTKAFWVECRGHDGFLAYGATHGEVRARTRAEAGEMGYRLAFGDIRVTRRPDQDPSPTRPAGDGDAARTEG